MRFTDQICDFAKRYHEDFPCYGACSPVLLRGVAAP